MSNSNRAPIQRKTQQELSRRDFLRYSGILVAATTLNPQLLLPLFNMLGTNGPPLRSLAQRIIAPSGKLFKIGIYLEDGDMNDPTGIPEQLAAQQFNHRVVNGIDVRAYKEELNGIFPKLTA